MRQFVDHGATVLVNLSNDGYFSRTAAREQHLKLVRMRAAENRRWILRSDKMQTDPFGVRSVRAMMHPGYQNPNYIGPSGPVDTDLSLVGIRSAGGRPIAA